jgi:hypothetical protein
MIKIKKLLHKKIKNFIFKIGIYRKNKFKIKNVKNHK